MKDNPDLGSISIPTKADIPDTTAMIENLMQDCTLCPRHCHVNRLAGQTGYCGETAAIKAARAALHYWEEPCISGTRGSGTVFFSGCSLRCVFCQNYNIANGNAGKAITADRLVAIFLELQSQGAHNINLVTPSHYIPQIVIALKSAKRQGLDIPVVYNTSGYEEVSSLQLLDGLVDIYLPDLKYVSPELSAKLSHAPDYFEKASAALAEMFRQVGTPVFTEQADFIQEPEMHSILKRGMIVRHLVLPGQTKDSKKVLRFLHETYGDNIYVSIMNQYTPLQQVTNMSDLNRHVTAKEYERVLRFADRLCIRNGFIQEGEAATESFIPEFDGRGL